MSSYQLDEASRGFSYKAEAPLDMRMDQSAALTAADVVNGYSEKELIRILRDYGEERFSPLIARRICERRVQKPIETTTELAETVAGAIPAKFRFKEQQHPARRCFQAMEDRIVKTAFRTAENPCICPPKSPQCICGRTPYGRILTKHPLTACEQEQRENSRSVCCKLRALEKTDKGIGTDRNTYRERRVNG